MSYRTEIRNDQPQIFNRRQAAALLGVPIILAIPFFTASAGKSALELTAGLQSLPDSLDDPI